MKLVIEDTTTWIYGEKKKILDNKYYCQWSQLGPYLGIRVLICRKAYSRMSMLNKLKQAGTELGQAQLKLELELSFTWFKSCYIKLIDINTTGYFDCH